MSYQYNVHPGYLSNSLPAFLSTLNAVSPADVQRIVKVMLRDF